MARRELACVARLRRLRSELKTASAQLRRLESRMYRGADVDIRRFGKSVIAYEDARARVEMLKHTCAGEKRNRGLRGWDCLSAGAGGCW